MTVVYECNNYVSDTLNFSTAERTGWIYKNEKKNLCARLRLTRKTVTASTVALYSFVPAVVKLGTSSQTMIAHYLRMPVHYPSHPPEENTSVLASKVAWRIQQSMWAVVWHQGTCPWNQ